MILSGYGMFILFMRFRARSDLIMTIPDCRPKGVTFNYERIRAVSEIVRLIFFSISLESRELLQQINAIPVKSPISIVYRSGSEEAERILNELGVDQPDRILVGALPKQS